MDLYRRLARCPLLQLLLIIVFSLSAQGCADSTGTEASARVAALDGGRPQSLLGRWLAEGEVFVFAADGRLFRHKEAEHTRQRYRWDATSGVLLLGATQMYYPELEASEMATAFGGESVFQSALDRSYCVELEELSEQSAQIFNFVQVVEESLVFKPPARSALEKMMSAVSTQQGLNRRRLQVDDALRLSPASL